MRLFSRPLQGRQVAILRGYVVSLSLSRLFVAEGVCSPSPTLLLLAVVGSCPASSRFACRVAFSHTGLCDHLGPFRAGRPPLGGFPPDILILPHFRGFVKRFFCFSACFFGLTCGDRVRNSAPARFIGLALLHRPIPFPRSHCITGCRFCQEVFS